MGKDEKPLRKPRNIESRGSRRNHFDRAARQAKRQRPNRALARPIENVIHRREDVTAFKPVVENSHSAILPHKEPEYIRAPGFRQTIAKFITGDVILVAQDLRNLDKDERHVVGRCTAAPGRHAIQYLLLHFS